MAVKFLLVNENQFGDFHFDHLSTVPRTGRDRMPEECQTWVKNGDCFLHQEFMLQNCRESCMAGGYVNGKCTVNETFKRVSITLLMTKQNHM